MAIVNIFLFVLGLILLVKGADFFIRSAAVIARKYGLSEFVIGLTLVALGTSIPELASSIVASLKHNPDLILGNIIGSNIANIGLILGLSATLTFKKTRKAVLKRDGYIMVFSAVIFYLFALNGIISRIEAAILFVFYLVYLLFLFKVKPDSKIKSDFSDFIKYFYKLEYITTIRSRIFGKNKNKSQKQSKKLKVLFKESIVKDILIMIISGIGIVYGAKLLVEEAIYFADLLNLSGAFTGVLILAIGTSIPELFVSLTAQKNGHSSMAIGNILGSNIANIFLVIGLSGVIFPITVASSILLYIAPFMIFLSFLLIYFIRTNWKISKTEGVILLALYVLFILFIFFGLFEKIV